MANMQILPDQQYLNLGEQVRCPVNFSFKITMVTHFLSANSSFGTSNVRPFLWIFLN